ncbi:uncharacterized protein C3orf38 homolog [Homarus americanus]|uniref:Uncharacterized protein n=1 Tax=Homarus americanus TaxID=6706 RepID=A0A8J5MZ75_HOMAM|nr:uncharacterized protein C3orf38 homolog [Homarus americanus]XP_042221956.1 uncharacterized protein C3orf38 homolog [Homarus americanus]KAG7168876.1 hypothetical protein Hamer_G011548 [Homarus americanus]
MSLAKSPFVVQIKELLQLLDAEALLALARTATNNRILPLNAKEAIEIILLHTPDLGRLFSYRRITSQVLFTYLHDKKVSSAGFSNKNQLMLAIQDLWAKQSNKDVVSEHVTVKRRATSSPESKCRKGRREVRSNSTGALGNFVGGDVSITNICVKQYEVSGVQVLPTCVVTPTQSRATVVRSDEFTRDFCEWYFTMVNRLQPECAHLIGDMFREEIFYHNSTTDIYLIGQTSEELHAQGGANTFALLRDTFNKFGLLFSPNLENGTQAFKSNHGMVRICCCGTLHHANSFVGIFEQENGLICSPVDRTWKIMYIKINLRQMSGQTVPPSLPPCQVFEIET